MKTNEGITDDTSARLSRGFKEKQSVVNSSYRRDGNIRHEQSTRINGSSLVLCLHPSCSASFINTSCINAFVCF